MFLLSALICISSSVFPWLCDLTFWITVRKYVHVCSGVSNSVAHQTPLFMGFFQARMLESVAISPSRVSSPPRDRTGVSCLDRQILYHWATISVQFSRSVLSDSWWPHGVQHARPPCPLPTLQTHVHWVSDAIQPSHLLLSPSPPTFSRSQHQGLFKWVSSMHQVAKVLEFQLQHQCFQWIFRTDFL